MSQTIFQNSKDFFLLLNNASRRYLVTFLIRILKVLRPRTSFSYAPELSRDGLGAQLQRILAIYHLANSMKVGYLHTGIEQTTKHALDGFASHDEYCEYLRQIRLTFNIHSTINDDFDEILTLEKLKLVTVLHYGIKSILLNKRYLLRVSEPFSVSDFIVPLYESLPIFPKFEELQASLRPNRTEPIFAIHYRNASGEFDLYHDQQAPRQLPLSFFSQAFDGSCELLKLVPQTVEFNTDAPETDLKFRVTPDETKLWEGTPGYSSGYLHIKGLSDESILRAMPIGVEVSIYRGGNPLQTLARLASADILIMSKSSLSYVAALLGKGHKIYPRGFWHPPLPRWDIR
jgi:hypothetical protein